MHITKYASRAIALQIYANTAESTIFIANHTDKITLFFLTFLGDP
jgi:hypothetical protein